MSIKEKDFGAYFFEKYKLGEYIDKGGNGNVYKVIRKCDGSTFALKYLKENKSIEWNEKRKIRFKDEIRTLEHLKKLKNPYVIPLIDYNTSEDGRYWYIMPIGKTISNFFRDEKVMLLEKINYFIDIAKGIKSIHELNYYHRDIKPNNILVVNGKIRLADFGLVWHPSFDLRTHKGEKIGPIETIAPEMREDNPDFKHSSKADVYSFVKTIWMLLLDRNRAFTDQYSYETNDYLECDMENFWGKEIKTFTRLNELIMKGTEYTPINRPTFDEIIRELELFIQDSSLPDVEIAAINEVELIKRNLHMIKSDSESYTDSRKIRDFLNDMMKGIMYTIGIELSDEIYDIKFNVSKIQESDIENGLVFINSSSNKRYLVKVCKLEVEKSANNLILSTDNVKIEDLPLSPIYEYKDFYSTRLMERVIGNFDEENDKFTVEVMSKSERFILKRLHS